MTISVRDTLVNLAALNPRIALGQQGLETDTAKTKTGDGINSWNNLPYDVAVIAAAPADVVQVAQAVVAAVAQAVALDDDSAYGTGTGNVTGPGSATNNHLAVFDGITGKLIKDGGAIPSVNATLTTALTVDTGTVQLTGAAANTSHLTLGAGA